MTRHHRKAVAFTAAGTGGLLGSAAASALVGPALLPALVAGGMAAFVFCGARALRLFGVDDIVFDPAMRRGRYAPPPVSAAPLRRRISRAAAGSPFGPRNVETHP